MVAIGGKTKKPKLPSQPQIVVQRAFGVNEFMRLSTQDDQIVISWVGDPNSATKYSSRYDAKNKTRELADVPETRVFQVLA